MGNLLETIARETGVIVRGEEDRHKLAGVFNRYRPNGFGLERLFNAQGVEGDVLSRLRRLFKATESGPPSDLYFLVQDPPAIGQSAAIELAEKHVESVRALLWARGDARSATLIATASPQFVSLPEPGSNDLERAIHEHLTDWLGACSQVEDLMVLEEAIFSMASDYWLTIYVLWPALTPSFPTEIAAPYFELWRHGLAVKFSSQGTCFVSSTPRSISRQPE